MNAKRKEKSSFDAMAGLVHLQITYTCMIVGRKKGRKHLLIAVLLLLVDRLANDNIFAYNISSLSENSSTVVVRGVGSLCEVLIRSVNLFFKGEFYSKAKFTTHLPPFVDSVRVPLYLMTPFV